MYSGPEWTSCPSPTRIPRPPAAKNCLASPEASFTATATPTVSSGRPHLAPVTDSPSATVLLNLLSLLILTLITSRNILLLPSLPHSIPYRQANVRRRKDALHVGT